MELCSYMGGLSQSALDMRDIAWCARAVAFCLGTARGSSTVFLELVRDGGENCDDGDGGDSGGLLTERSKDC